MTTDRLIVEISAKIKPLEEGVAQVNKKLKGLEQTTEQANNKMSKSFNKSVASVSKLKVALGLAAVAAVKVGKAIWSAGNEAITMDNQMMGLTRTMGSSTNEFLEWGRTSATAFGISEKMAVSVGNQFSSIISRTKSSGKEVSDLTKEMLQLGAVIQANTHFDIDDVMGRLRSGLSGRNEAIEDLGIEVKPGVIKSTQAYAAAVRDTGLAWEKMSDAQQANIRIQAIIEQGQNRYGNSLSGVAQKIAQLRAQIANMTMEWGRAVAPIVSFVIPVLQKLVGWLTIAAMHLRAFIGLFFKVEDAAGRVNKPVSKMGNTMAGVAGDAAGIAPGLDKATAAAKKFNRQLLGFDVIHNIDEPVDNAASGMNNMDIGGVGEPDFGDFDFDDSPLQNAADQIEAIQERILKAWNTWGKKLAAVAGIVAGIMSLPLLASGLEMLVGWVAGLAGEGGLLGKVFTGLFGIFESIGGVITGAFGGTVDGLAAAMTGAGVTIAAVIATIAAVIQSWKENILGFRDTWTQVWENIKGTFIKFVGVLSPYIEVIIGMFKSIWDNAIKPLWDGFVHFVAGVGVLIGEIINFIWPLVDFLVQVLGHTIGVGLTFITGVLTAIATLVGKVVGGILKVFGNLLGWLGDFLKKLRTGQTNFGEFFSKSIDFIKEVFSTLMGFFSGVWDAIKSIFSAAGNAISAFLSATWNVIKTVIETVWTGIKLFFTHTLQAISTLFSTIWNGIKTVLTVTMNVIKAMIETVWNGIKAYYTFLFNALLTLTQTVWSGIKLFFVVTLQAISTLFNVIWNGIKTFMTVTFNTIQSVVTAVWNAIKTFLTTTMNVINVMFTTVWNAIKTTITTILNLIKTVITTVWDSIKTFVTTTMNVINTMFAAVWNAIKVMIETVMNTIKTIITNVWNAIRNLFDTVLGGIKNIVTNTFNAVKNTISTVMDSVKNKVSSIMNGIRATFQGVLDFVKNVFSGQWSAAWTGVVNTFKKLFNTVPTIFKKAWNNVLKLFNSGGQIFTKFSDSVANIFKKLVNSLISGINRVIAAPFNALNNSFARFRNIKLLGMKPFNWLPSINVPKIPSFMDGGFPKGENGLFYANSNELVGKFTNGKTAVANNDQIVSGVSTGVANAVRSVLADKVDGGNQPIHVTVQIGTEKIAKEVIDAVDDYTLKTGMTFKTI